MENHSLISPKKLKKKYPIKDSKNILSYKQNLVDIFLKKQKKIMVIVGPCSIHNETEALEYLDKLQALQRDLKNIYIVMRAFFEKPRSSIGWKGFLYDPYLDKSNNISDGIIKTRKLLINLSSKMPIATEFLDPLFSNYINDLISYGIIGARTVRSPIHRQLASSFSFPIGFKNSLDGDIDAAINAAIFAKNKQNYLNVNQDGKIATISSEGNQFCSLILRGSNKSINFSKTSIDIAVSKMKDQMQDIPIIVDCSHGNSKKDHTNQILCFESIIEQIIDGNTSIVGIMLESYLYEGKQTLQNPINLRYGVSITDSCLDFKTTKELLIKADKLLDRTFLCL